MELAVSTFSTAIEFVANKVVDFPIAQSSACYYQVNAVPELDYWNDSDHE